MRNSLGGMMRQNLLSMNENARSAGFTLLEILVVVMIITILATIVGVGVAKKPGVARQAAAKAQIAAFKTAVNLYRMDQGRVPAQEQGLNALVAPPSTGPEVQNYPADGYLDSRKVPLDPWKREYIYMAPASDGSSFEIISYGSDGEPGGAEEAADITSMDL